MVGGREVDPLTGLRGLAAFHVMVFHFFANRLELIQSIAKVILDMKWMRRYAPYRLCIFVCRCW